MRIYDILVKYLQFMGIAPINDANINIKPHLLLLEVLNMKNLHNNKSDQTTDYSFTLDIEQLLKQGNIIRIKPQGTSMYPLFVPGRDEACIEHTDFSSLKRGDVILYRRDKSILVLHRIWKITDNSLYMVGDNQTEIEGPLRADQVRGKLIGVIRNGYFIDVHNPLYRIISGLWLWLRPFRPIAWKITALFRRLKRKH